MMDAHLRTYFSANTVQIEIDASLFSKALETIDPVLTKKLYVQLSIPPARITRPWWVHQGIEVPRVSCHSGSPRCSSEAFRWTSCTACGIYFCMTVSCPPSSEMSPRPTGQPPVGIPYLMRVGLVVINCVRHLLLQASSEETALAHLAHPPPACLPSATELLVLAANVKLKDDDVRKQRIKMEQQLKRTTQARPPNGVSIVQTATISLPRT